MSIVPITILLSFDVSKFLTFSHMGIWRQRIIHDAKCFIDQSLGVLSSFLCPFQLATLYRYILDILINKTHG